MTFLAYVLRRTIGAVVVFLLVVLLTMFAVASIGPFGIETGPPGLVRIDEARMNLADIWASFPAQALGVFGLAAVAAIAWRLRASRR